ncbi:PREDICTED: coilin [Crocodylus porosus]|uniref:Coilin n=1 Tax=Crocodylus porosus TaxID=8502 RepID=A0A7M4E1G6_CROPO|nr:PREDICTED: coilin [Crocodylus porosus]
MAAAFGADATRLLLHFDFPPPRSPGCARCWLLLEPGQARLVTDLASLVRDKFGFSRRARISLFLDGALLPPTESARVVRDNDCLRVKLEEVTAEGYNEDSNGFVYSSRKVRKRHRQKLEEEEEITSEDDRPTRKKMTTKRSSEHAACKDENTEDAGNYPKKSKNRKKKKELNRRDGRAECKDSATDQSKTLKKSERKKELETKKNAKQKTTKAVATKSDLGRLNHSIPLCQSKNSAVKNAMQSSKEREGTSDSDSSSLSDTDSETDAKQDKFSHKSAAAMQHKERCQVAASSAAKTVATSKVTAKSKEENSPKIAVSKKAKSPSSSSESDSSTEEEQSNNSKKKSPPNNSTTVENDVARAPKAKTSLTESKSSDSDTLVIKKSIATVGLNNSLVKNDANWSQISLQGPAASPGSFGRGRGRGEDNYFWRGSRGRGYRGGFRGRGRGRGENSSFFYNYSNESQKQQQLNEVVTNTSAIIQNPVEVPKRDYSVLPLLAAPPQIGEKIAFKCLELTENYTPEVSDYKEGKIVSWNAESKQIEIEILSSSSNKLVKEPGKFDLVYQSADGAETIEYAVSQETKVTESWDALIEPRLIVESSSTELSTENEKN